MNRFKHILTLAVCLTACIGSAEVLDLRCEYLINPMGLDAAHPRLSWILDSSRRGARQTAYQILVASSPQILAGDKGDLWDSGKVSSAQTAQIEYQGQSLTSREHCYWKVRSWDRDDHAGDWSRPSDWQMGLLDPADWSAKWISAGAPPAGNNGPLVIREATYQGPEGQGSADVTALLVRHISNNRIDIIVNNRILGGDPAPQQPKTLQVVYESGGNTFTNEYGENETLTIPAGSSALPFLRKSFSLDQKVQKAVLYVTALGLYEIHINGHRVGDHVLAPDWTDYRKRVRYQAYDVTDLLKKGDNAVASMLANGWYAGHIGNGGFQFFGKVPSLLAQLEITRQDGSMQTIVTDASWKSHTSPILSSDFMMGEDYDARLEIKNWDKSDLDETSWQTVALRDAPAISLETQVSQPVREITELKPKKITEPRPGAWVYDLGQNMVGVVRLKVSAPTGTKITLRHAEMLSPDGTLYTKNLRGAPSIDHYICKGEGTEVWQPRFTFHGFRYVEISGLTDKPGPEAVTGIVIASDTPRTGEFACSDPRINQLQSNIQWGQRGNYLSVPTDCPQRDERLGWMGDAEVFVRTATYNADVAAFFTKWLVDVDDGQTPEGSFSDVSPNTMGANGVPAWGDAGVICPWTIYSVYGDKRILENDLPYMIKWVEYLHRHSDSLIRDRDRGNDYGDWLSIKANTPKDLIGTAFFAYSTHLVAQSCAALGRSEEAAKYEQLFQDIKAAFIKKYVDADGHVRGDTQCAYLLALSFDLLPDDLRAKVAQHLQDDIEAKDWHLSTGFVGVSHLLPVLTQMGKSETACRLLLQDTFPSWLFSVKQGATTIWERWDGWTPDKGFQDPGMNSFNHYSLGSCGEYLFGGIGGIRPASPGFDTILIDPEICKAMTWAKTSYDSIHGKIATSWKLEGNRLSLEVIIPDNTTAMVKVPSASAGRVRESGKSLDQAEGVKLLRQENGRTIVSVGSGRYEFSSEL